MPKSPFTSALWLCLLLCIAGQVSAQTKGPSEYAVKAAFLHAFTKFVEWPPDEGDQRDSLMRICVIGDSPFGDELEHTFEGKKSGGKAATITYAQSVEELPACDVLFIAQSEEDTLDRILKELTNRATLSISDIDGFAERGGIIGFFVAANKIRFKINVDAAEEAGLQFSSKLLRLANIVD